MRDIRDDILRGLGEEEDTASSIADDDGIVKGIKFPLDSFLLF